MEAQAHIFYAFTCRLRYGLWFNFSSKFAFVTQVTTCSFISIWVNVRNLFGDRPFLEMISDQVTHCIISTKTRTLKLKGCRYEYFAISDTTYQNTLRCSQRPRSICRDYVSVTGGILYWNNRNIFTIHTHIMMTSWYGNISALLALCEGNPSVTSGFSWQSAGNAGFDVSFDVTMNKQLKNEVAGNPQRSYDVTVMTHIHMHIRFKIPISSHHGIYSQHNLTILYHKNCGRVCPHSLLSFFHRDIFMCQGNGYLIGKHCRTDLKRTTRCFLHVSITLCAWLRNLKLSKINSLAPGVYGSNFKMWFSDSFF